MVNATAAILQNVTDMYRDPSTKSERVSQAVFGETVSVLEIEEDFALVVTPDEYRGWVRRNHIWLHETGDTYPSPNHAALTTPLHMPVFRDPSTRSERITLLTIGSIIEIIPGAHRDGFVGIRMPGQGLAFAEESNLIVPEYPDAEHLGASAALIARAMIGVPYLWGGRTTFGFDCSGFVQRVFWLCGRILPRDAYQQAQFSELLGVDRSNIKPGDLLFFNGENGDRGHEITHVGLALGDKRFVHASGALGTSITEMDDPKYLREFHSAIRICG